MNNTIPYIWANKEIVRDSIINTLFPFTLYRGKTRGISEDTLLKYEVAATKLLKNIDRASKLLAIKEGKEPDTKYQLKLLEEIKKTL